MKLGVTFAGFGLVMMAVTLRAAAGDVSTADRDRIQEKLSEAFISPQTTLWHYDDQRPYVSGERVVCGWVNFQSAQQRYVGYHQFYAILEHGKLDIAQIDDAVSDTSGKLAEKLHTLCGDFKQPK